MSRFLHFVQSRVSGQHDVGHEGVITGCDGFSLRSSIADPQGVDQPQLQPTFCNVLYITKSRFQFYSDESIFVTFQKTVKAIR
ncbi:hypothetical protein CWD94_26095 [Lysinibacillus xylanilyticus]|uniref:Uncharacterized protein n=1 Tax=Lysinibacillus xylanilyticus TaxID=582475 RepID=A0A2M9PYG0_9BACI|nr:hypothetical protein CWD94_26095 [Lysinibacillus xylanilyticus]